MSADIIAFPNHLQTGQPQATERVRRAELYRRFDDARERLFDAIAKPRMPTSKLRRIVAITEGIADAAEDNRVQGD